jgi:hypothetical protein
MSPMTMSSGMPSGASGTGLVDDVGVVVEPFQIGAGRRLGVGWFVVVFGWWVWWGGWHGWDLAPGLGLRSGLITGRGPPMVRRLSLLSPLSKLPEVGKPLA